MKLIIGGYAQGKLDYVCTKYSVQKGMVWEGIAPEAVNEINNAGGPIVVNHFHRWVRKCMEDGRCPEDETRAFLESCQSHHKECIIISDEIGNGIVPIDAFEREYRERLGRILIQTAHKAEEVERVICGIGQKIK